MSLKKSSLVLGAVVTACFATSPYAILATDTDNIDLSSIKKGVGLPGNKRKADDNWIKKPAPQAMDTQKETQKAATQKTVSKPAQQPNAKPTPPKASAGAGKPVNNPPVSIKEQAALNKQARNNKKGKVSRDIESPSPFQN